jgi:hypothetical protein
MGGYYSSLNFGTDTYVYIPGMESLRNPGIKLEGGSFPAHLTCLAFGIHRRSMLFIDSYTEASLIPAFGNFIHRRCTSPTPTSKLNLGLQYRYNMLLLNTRQHCHFNYPHHLACVIYGREI